MHFQVQQHYLDDAKITLPVVHYEIRAGDNFFMFLFVEFQVFFLEYF